MKRLQSIDFLRGAIMVLMAIDHVRVYSGVPSGGLEPSIFFTRWITHFCAPGFVFFAGTAAFFYGQKIQDAAALARYLFSRGLLLVVLELTLIRFGWTFNLNFSEFTLAGVIWMIGWCMILLSLMVRLRPTTIGITGMAIIFLQQLFAWAPHALPETWQSSFGYFWEFIYTSGLQPWKPVSILYVIVPWIGVMCVGYGFGNILVMEQSKRDKLCVRIGLLAIGLYLVIGTILILFHPSSEDTRPFLFKLLAQQKYPPSQLFLMMTLGPLIALVPLAERAKGLGAEVLKTFGRVPFFYYLLHIPLIHLSALLVNVIVLGDAHQEFYGSAPFTFMPPELRWSIPLLYLVFVIDVVILYLACRWYVQVKQTHTDNRLLKYL